MFVVLFFKRKTAYELRISDLSSDVCSSDLQQVKLAMRRLSIIDLDGCWQPIYNEDKSLAVICNGEIYNYIELRKELEKRGHRFSTNSDVETIVHQIGRASGRARVCQDV